MWTLETLKRFVTRSINYPGYDFLVMEKGDGFLIQCRFYAPDAEKPDAGVVEQKGRKWYTSSHATQSEVVETCFAAVTRAVQHEVREQFLFKGARVYSPHFHVDALAELCDREAYDVRD